MKDAGFEAVRVVTASTCAAFRYLERTDQAPKLSSVALNAHSLAYRIANKSSLNVVNHMCLETWDECAQVVPVFVPRPCATHREGK